MGWQRIYDNWIFRLSGFHYPQTSTSALKTDPGNFGQGYGGQLMVIFNH
jgi:hypothetical protein